MDPAFEAADAIFGDGRGQPRPVAAIFPSMVGIVRDTQLRAAWLSFDVEMRTAVRGALDSGRSPSEIAYAIGEIVHTYFRAHSVTLTSFELRQHVAELLGRSDREGAVDPVAAPPAPGSPLVVFAFEPSTTSGWTGDEMAAPAPVLPESAFEPPPSALVSLSPRGTTAKDGLPSGS